MFTTATVSSRPAHAWELPEELWEALEASIIDHNAHRGRPRSVDRHRIAAGVCYVPRTGIQWQAPPRERFGPPGTVYHDFRQWADDGVFAGAWAKVLATYDAPHGIVWD